MSFIFTVIILALSSAAHSQSTLFCDPQHGCFQQLSLKDNDLQIGIALPPMTAKRSQPSEFVTQIVVAREGYGFTGLAVGEAPIETTWPPHNTNEDKRGLDESDLSARRISPRVIQGNVLQPIEGLKITELRGTTQNATHFITLFRCQNCLSNVKIEHGSTSETSVSLVLSPIVPNPIQDVNAFLPFREQDFTHFKLNLASAVFSDYYERLEKLLP